MSAAPDRWEDWAREIEQKKLETNEVRMDRSLPVYVSGISTQVKEKTLHKNISKAGKLSCEVEKVRNVFGT